MWLPPFEPPLLSKADCTIGLVGKENELSSPGQTCGSGSHGVLGSCLTLPKPCDNGVSDCPTGKGGGLLLSPYFVHDYKCLQHCGLKVLSAQTWVWGSVSVTAVPYTRFIYAEIDVFSPAYQLDTIYFIPKCLSCFCILNQSGIPFSDHFCKEVIYEAHS